MLGPSLDAALDAWLASGPALDVDDPVAELPDDARHYERMSNIRRDPRLVPTPLEIQKHAARLIDELGPRGAAKRLGVSRDTALSLAAGLDVMPGSIALAQLAMQREGTP